MMNNALEKQRSAERALDIERQLMNEALGRLERVERNNAIDRPAGRLMFALDLTGSREHSLRHARIATAAMFDAVKAIGAVYVKLIYYRGNSECRAGAWHRDPAIVYRSMLSLTCKTGETQIARLLRVVLAEEIRISGVVFVGDHCEDDPVELRKLAQTLGQRSTPLFIFHECADHDNRFLIAKPVFMAMAQLSGGVYVEFKPDSGIILREMLSSVAAFSAAGVDGVQQMAFPRTPEARQLHGRLLLGPGAGSQRKS